MWRFKVAIGKVIAIGGGSTKVRDTLPSTLLIDFEAVRLAELGLARGRRITNVLFIPTASGDSILYSHDIYNQFSRELGCNFDDLRLLRAVHTQKNIADKIEWADLIYVGGGDTRLMMNVWEEEGVSDLLRQAHQDGKVMMGLSAGSICWFEAGLSDSEKFSGNPNWKPIWVSGLGLLPLLHSPHLDSEDWRREELAHCLATGELPKPVIALEDDCAIEVVGEEYRIINSAPNKNAYLYHGHTMRQIAPSQEFRPISELTSTARPI